MPRFGFGCLLLALGIVTQLGQASEANQDKPEHHRSGSHGELGSHGSHSLAQTGSTGPIKVIKHAKKSRHGSKQHSGGTQPVAAAFVQESAVKKATGSEAGKANSKADKPKVTHIRGDTGKRLLKEMESLIQNKGKVGLNDEEKAFIEEIQSLWKEDVMPAIESAIAGGRDRVNDLFAAILACDQHLGEDSDNHVNLLRNINETKEDLEDCARQESNLVVKKDKECKHVSDMKSGFMSPPTTPGPDATDAQKLKYLKDMDKFFCGTTEDFKDEWDECKNVTDDHTDVSNNCTTIQGRLEDFFCQWKNGPSGLCQTYDSCRQLAIQNYLNATKEVKETVDEEHKEYIAAVRIECLWDAWNLSDAPCLVDPEKVEECYNKPVNMSNLTVSYPMVPDPHECSMDAEGQILTHGDEDHPCTEEYLSLHYVSMDLNEQVIQKMRNACKKCIVVDKLTVNSRADLPLDADTFRSQTFGVVDPLLNSNIRQADIRKAVVRKAVVRKADTLRLHGTGAHVHHHGDSMLLR